MRLLRFSLKSFIDNKKKAILNLMICMVTVVLVNVFAGNIISVREQLARLPDAIKIHAIISNLNGSMDAGLKIKEKYVDGILASNNVVNPVFSVQFKMGFGEFGIEDYQGKLNYYATGSNNVAGIPGLLEKELKFTDGTYSRDFFSSSKRICIMDEHLLNEKKLVVGDEITLTTFYYRYGDYHDIYIEPLESGSFRIVGTMEMKEYLGEGVQPDILIPFETARNIYHENKFDFLADAGSFRIKNPYKLNDFKKEMHELGFLPVSFRSEFQYDGNALTVKDDTFISSAEQLIKSRNLLAGILPFLGLAVLCIGFVMAELLMKSRISEYAIMRSLGQSHKESLCMLVMEYGLSAFAGSTLGILISIICLKTTLGVASLAAVTFFICYITGTMVALLSLKKLSIMSVLSKND